MSRLLRCLEHNYIGYGVRRRRERVDTARCFHVESWRYYVASGEEDKQTGSQSITNGLTVALTLWEFRTSQVSRVHCDVSSASRVQADFITLDDNTCRLGLHSVAYGLELRGEARWSSQV